jgi:hypothetical protein
VFSVYIGHNHHEDQTISTLQLIIRHLGETNGHEKGHKAVNFYNYYTSERTPAYQESLCHRGRLGLNFNKIDYYA